MRGVTDRRWSLPVAALAAAIGALAGVAAMFWGPGSLMAVVVLGLTVSAFLGRGWRAELPWAFIGAGLLPLVVLAPALLNSDPAVHYSPETIPALLVADLVVAVGALWAASAALSDGGPGPSGTPTSAVRLGLAIAAPLAGLALAYGLWWISDRLLYIGPFDRAAFGWLVVVPVWALTPLATAFAWRRLSRRETTLAASVVGSILSLVATLLFWIAIAHPGCEFGAVRTPAELLLPSLLVGVVIGAGFAAICLATLATLRQARWWAAVIVSAGSGVGLIFLAILASMPVLISPACQRPPI
jgi:hypothetical protein